MSVRAVILGGEGMLGQALARLLPAAGLEVVAAVGRQGCDVTQEASVAAALHAHRPDLVFNTAAYTNVDGAEDDVETSWRVNALGPELIARVCRAANAKLVHFSTDFVFDGEKETPYDEFDVAAPNGVYARSKLAGEQLSARAWERVFVVRVGCLYGRAGRNFPSTIAARLLAGQTIRADASRSGTPTWADDVARTVAPLSLTDAFGLYHCTSAGETTWYDYARHVAQILGIPAERVGQADLAALKLKAPRPRRAVLDNRMLRLRGLDAMPQWQDAALAYLQQEHSGR